MELKALGSTVIMRPDDRKEITDGGIIIPEYIREAPMVGTIIAIGPQVETAGLQAGVRVMFEPHGGRQFEHEKVLYYVFEEDAVIGCVVAE